MNRRRTAVVGGGIFGVTAAIRLSRAGHVVDLFEKNSDLMTEASYVNQYRLHRGYHYPRSPDTAVCCRDDEESFLGLYSRAVLSHFDHYFAISKNNSITSAAQYVAFLDQMGLEYSHELPPFLNHGALEACFRVKERCLDLGSLYGIAWKELAASDVIVHLSRRFTFKDVPNYKHVVVAAYAKSNELLEPNQMEKYQFEVVEKPVLTMPDSLRDKSVVIMDGPFMCVDPMATTGRSVMGHVTHAVHSRNVGFWPDIPVSIFPYLNFGVVKHVAPTNIRLFLESASEYFPEIEKSKHVGSMYTVRTVLTHTEKTDARPTIVTLHNNTKIVTIFSGKIGSCVRAADQVVDLLA